MRRAVVQLRLVPALVEQLGGLNGRVDLVQLHRQLPRNLFVIEGEEEVARREGAGGYAQVCGGHVEHRVVDLAAVRHFLLQHLVQAGGQLHVAVHLKGVVNEVLHALDEVVVKVVELVFQPVLQRDAHAHLDGLGARLAHSVGWHSVPLQQFLKQSPRRCKGAVRDNECFHELGVQLHVRREGLHQFVERADVDLCGLFVCPGVLVFLGAALLLPNIHVENIVHHGVDHFAALLALLAQEACERVHGLQQLVDGQRERLARGRNL
mmetsp:Transcript_17425/g.44376  ORF Transcript_17425/g.44376 Transcript_17425/m.44376 type:complete len:265 (+) Transcript_17425:271-1065(+)